MNSTGIAVFAYNRPEHLRQVLNSLQENNVEHVYFFVDGPKKPDDEQAVNQVKNVIKRVDWCDKTVVTRDRNHGLAHSITSGINRVFEDNNRIIVLEDDCVPAANFVSFMQQCLERYSSEERVMNINGYGPPISVPDEYPYDVYFTRRSSSWGWATWESAWDHFEQDPMTLDELRSNSGQIKQVTKKAGGDLFPMMRNQLRGEIDSWAVWWSYAIAANNGLCVTPVNSRIQNIGVDGTGTHVGNTDKYNSNFEVSNKLSIKFPDSVAVNDQLNTRYNNFVSGGKYGKVRRLAKSILRALGLRN